MKYPTKTEEQSKNIDLWLKALRSDNYKQGYGRLKNLNNEFCCLGVACEIFNTKGYASVFLDEATMRTLGIDQSGSFDVPTISKTNSYSNLTAINDSRQFTFNEIADIIEEQLKAGNL